MQEAYGDHPLLERVLKLFKISNSLYMYTNSHFGLVNSAEISNRIKPDYSIFPSQKNNYNTLTFQWKRRQNRFGLKKRILRI